MSKKLTITLELTVDVASDFKLNPSAIKGKLEDFTPLLDKSAVEFLYNLGSFTDAEVVGVSLLESHDTRM